MKRRVSIVLAVIASWMLAVTVLVTTLHFLPVTPGYAPDHIE
jgi:hypothetical protein